MEGAGFELSRMVTSVNLPPSAVRPLLFASIKTEAKLSEETANALT